MHFSIQSSINSYHHFGFRLPRLVRRLDLLESKKAVLQAGCQNITVSKRISILCAALSGSEIVLQPTQPFRAGLNTAALRAGVSQVGDSGLHSHHIYTHDNPYTSTAAAYIFAQMHPINRQHNIRGCSRHFD
jgi:hypothetical protein